MNNYLEQAAQRTLAKITGLEEALKLLYLQPDRAIFLSSNSGIILKVYREGHTLQREHAVMQQVQAIRITTAYTNGFTIFSQPSPAHLQTRVARMASFACSRLQESYQQACRIRGSRNRVRCEQRALD